MRSPLDSEETRRLGFRSRFFRWCGCQNFSGRSKVRDRPAVEAEQDDQDDDGRNSQSWGTAPPELLREIITRVEETNRLWPDRRNVVACASVCKRWREVTKEIVGGWAPHGPGCNCITSLSSIKQPGPRDFLLHCVIEQNPRTSTIYLYLSPSQDSRLTAKGKFLLAARRYWRATHIEYIISCNPEDFSRGSDAYVGKLRSDVLGVNFRIYEGKTSCNAGHVSYKVNLREPKGPRLFVCSIRCHSCSDGGPAASPVVPNRGAKNQQHMGSMLKQARADPGSSSSSQYTVLRNKAPLWNEELEIFTLNFHGRVTLSSTRNFQLIAPPEKTGPPTGNRQGKEETEETIHLQLGKVAENTFTMDYGEPLSAFQAFAICLSSFGWKFPCQ